MRTRFIALSALAVVVTLGVIGMHAIGFGHGSSARSASGVAHERSTPATMPSTSDAATREPMGDGHTALVMSLCIAVLSVGLAFAAIVQTVRLRTHSLREPTALLHWVQLVMRACADPPPPVPTPLRT